MKTQLAEEYLKSKRKYPTIVVDNFFENPDFIRKFALSLSYEKDPEGKWPGERSKKLYNIDQSLQDFMANKILSIYFDMRYTQVTWEDSYLMFQKVERFSDIKDSLDNKGWIHVDDNQTFAGVVYLTPNINPNSGTSIFRLKDEYSDFNIHDLDVTPKIEKYRNDIFEKNKLLKLETDIKKTLDYMYKRFELVTEVKNIYNRCVIFDSNQYHTANEYYTDGEERLTFVYFFKNVKSTVLPLEKIYEHDEDIKNRIKSYEDSIS